MDLTLINALAPPFAALALGSLGLVSTASGRTQRVWRLFAVFALMLMCASLAATAAVSFQRLVPTVVAVRLIPAFAMLSVLFALFYVAELEQLSVRSRLGRWDFGFQWQRGGPIVTLFGRRLPFRRYLAGVLCFWGGLLGVVLTTPWVLESASVSRTNELVVAPGPLFPWAIAFALVALCKADFFLLRGWRSLPRGPRRDYVAWSFLGFNVAYTPALLSNLGAFWLGQPVQPAVFLCFPLAVLVFYVAIVRYQFAQIDELNRGLESKVLARTRQLEQAQTRLVQSEKMASLGRLVAGVAHEVNNPLGALSSMQQSIDRTNRKLVDLVLALPSDTPEQRERVAELERLLRTAAEASRVMADGTARVGGVVARLKRFARLDESAFQEADLNAGLSDTLELFRAGDDRRVVVETDLGALPPLHCDPRSLNQLWLNLLLNARDALRDGNGTITVSTRATDAAVVVRLRDTGEGIAPEHRARIFDPGFTTKGVGVGTGLGLSICYQIVEEHGGSIEIDSRLGRGTEVVVTLPRAAAAGREARGEGREARPRDVVEHSPPSAG